jgi:cobalt-zinc-cadmium efflux system protein
MKIIIILNIFLVIVQIFVGFLSGSLALLSDASHNFVDILTIFISSYAKKLENKKANATYSYGLKKAGILASILNSFILIIIAIYIFISAIQRFQNPQLVLALPVIFVSLLAIAINGFSAYLLANKTKDLNIKSVYINLFFDTIASVGALIGSIILYFQPQLIWIDSLVAILIAGLLLKGAIEIITEAIDILLDAVPKNIDMQVVKAKILEHNCVNEVVDLHIWSISSQQIVLSSVILINSNCLNQLDSHIEKIKLNLKTCFGIYHQTIETRIKAQTHQD